MPTSAEIAQQLAAYDANRKSSADVLNEAMSKYGVPEIRTRVSGLRTTLGNTENALNAVDPSVTGRTSRSLVTEAQRSRIVNKEREPIAAQYGEQSRALTNESANLSEQQRAAEMLAKGRMEDYTIGRNALQTQYNDSMSREAEQRRREEADRLFAFNKAESDRNYQLNLQTARSSGGGSAKTPKVTIGALFDGYNPKTDKFYTEKVVIPTLMSELGYSADKAKKTAYEYRKATFGE